MPLPVRWRYKLDRWRKALVGKLQSEPKVARPRLCPACGALVGSTATHCHQCGENLNYSLAAASRSIGHFMPQTSPVTYGILTLCCALFGISLLSTMRQSGFAAPTGGLTALFGMGGINSSILARMGASLPLPYDLQQPWRFVTAIFLHASLLHIGFNMWLLMDFAPTIEEMYGSARFLFIFVFTGACGYLASAASGHFSVGASGSLLGLVGLLLAVSGGRQSSAMRMLRSQLVYMLVYVAVMGVLMPGVDNLAHIGGFASGFGLGKLMADRTPADLTERRRANVLGWTAGIAVAASFTLMLLNYFYPALGRG